MMETQIYANIIDLSYEEALNHKNDQASWINSPNLIHSSDEMPRSKTFILIQWRRP